MNKFYPEDLAFFIMNLPASEHMLIDYSSSLQSLNGMDPSRLKKMIDVNQSRVDSGAWLTPVVAASLPADKNLPASGWWELKYKTNKIGSPIIEISGKCDINSVVDIFVDGYIVHRINVLEKLKLYIRTKGQLKNKSEVMLAVNGRFLPMRSGQDYHVCQTPEDAAVIDMAEGVLDGKFINKKGIFEKHHFSDYERNLVYLAAYAELRVEFKKLTGYDLYITHGTLLGYIRSGNFISSDDDFDCAYLSRHVTPEAVAVERDQIVSALKARGNRCKIGSSGHIKYKHASQTIDVMPAWHDGLYYNVSSYTSINFGAEDVNTLKTVDFLGTDVLIHHNPEGFLSLNYGESWRAPDPGYRHRPNNRCMANRKILEPIGASAA
jgi:hypothetical protein